MIHPVYYHATSQTRAHTPMALVTFGKMLPALDPLNTSSELIKNQNTAVGLIN